VIMAMDRIFKHITIIGICCIVIVCGCAQQGGKPSVEPKQQIQEAVKTAPQQAAVPGAAQKPAAVKIELKPTPGEKTSYKITTGASRSIKWQGPVPGNSAFEETSNEDRVEMAVTQEVQSVDAEGRAVVKVTINRLKYLSIVKNKPIMDFDSTRPSDSKVSLAGLIGQSYTIEVEPNNQVFSVLDLNSITDVVGGHAASDRMGRNIVSPEAIKERHSTLLLPQSGGEQFGPGAKWSRIKTFSFGLMGIKSYEKVYTLKSIQEAAGHQVVAVDMNAIPTSEIEEKFRNQQSGADFPKMFDTSETYTGTGDIDLTAGRINSYRENLQASWVAALPPKAGTAADSNEPVVLRMTSSRDYNLEKID
jgi:uncharacterized lipoprotein NlpE involved in copper resistance